MSLSGKIIPFCSSSVCILFSFTKMLNVKNNVLLGDFTGINLNLHLIFLRHVEFIFKRQYDC